MADAELSQGEISTLLSQYGGDLNARGDTGLSVILAAAHGDGRCPDLPVLKYLLEKEGIHQNDKIDALEMTGAVLLGCDDNHDKFPLAFEYWRRALALRQGLLGLCIYKEPTNSKSGQLSEWSTLDDLI